MTLARKPYREGAFSTIRPSRKPSKRSKDPVTPEVHALVFHRDGDCLLQGSTVPAFDVACAGPHQWAHRLSVEYGGPSVPSNGTRLCQLHHSRVDGAYRAEARAFGLRLRRGEVPSQVPVTLKGGRVLLTDDGRQEEVP